MTKPINFLTILLFFTCLNNLKLFAQNNRINTGEKIGWYNYFGTLKVNDKFGFHTEYQFRRDNLIEYWQQSLLRVGLNYQANPRVLFRIGYGWIETFPYGEIPINGLGRDFTEHRLFQMIQLSHRENIFDLSHRFMLEQRFVGSYSSAAVKSEDIFQFLNRIRYMLRLQTPIIKSEKNEQAIYLAFYDELFIGFGDNVNANIFDQNRIGILLAYNFNQNLKIEAGYLNQISQFGRQINGQNVFQFNNGLILNFYINLDLNLNKKL